MASNCFLASGLEKIKVRIWSLFSAPSSVRILAPKQFRMALIADPLGHFHLAIHHALLRRDVLGFKVQVHVPALGRLVDHADGDNELDHWITPGVERRAALASGPIFPSLGVSSGRLVMTL